ncbi:MAG TPA: hypothetical protein PK728_03445 [Bacillota bacterium]|nr:hypothetical protein [Bacillota bacterium]
MYRLLPFIISLAILPDSEKHLENLNTFIMAVKESVTSIRNGFDTFHATIKTFMADQAAKKTDAADNTGYGSADGGGSDS